MACARCWPASCRRGGPHRSIRYGRCARNNYALPVILGIAALFTGHALWGELSLIWSCHISFDRVLGYGLKFPKQFRSTHIQSAAAPATAG
ncbi:DUF4260 family protein [Silvibacterium sp.]|uniref:DUF4260 family protein n=1 Tax=Silvibacterium sp. TaxID=1964179 RepID=UPI0039E4B8D2